MCLISAFPRGTVKYNDYVAKFIASGMRSNSEGSGFMYRKHGDSKIHVHKGFFSIQQLTDAIKELSLKVDDELVIHHRIGTSGLVSKENCHPFIIAPEHSQIVNTNCVTEHPALVHNGIFRGLSSFMDKNPDFSDTYAFTRYIAFQNIGTLKYTPEAFTGKFNTMLSWSKICVLYPDKTMQFLGEGWITDQFGYKHSNQGYANYHHVDVGGVTKSSSCSSLPVKKKDPMNSLVNIINDKKPFTLNGESIEINNFNAKHFIFEYKVIDVDFLYKFNDFDQDCHINFLNRTIIESDTRLHGVYVDKSEIVSDFIYHPKHKYESYYKEYVRFIDKVPITKTLLKKVYKLLNKNRHKDFDHAFKVHEYLVTKFTLINVLLSNYQYYDVNLDIGLNNYNILSVFNFMRADFDTNIEVNDETIIKRLPITCSVDNEPDQSIELEIIND
jgi:predicted glutamine amidotransferase